MAGENAGGGSDGTIGGHDVAQYVKGGVATIDLIKNATTGKGKNEYQKAIEAGANVTTVGQTMVAAGATFPPWGLILSGVGLAVTAVGMSQTMNAINSLPGMEDATNRLKKQGASLAFTSAYAQFATLPTPQLRAEIDQLDKQKGADALEAKKAALWILDERALVAKEQAIQLPAQLNALRLQQEDATTKIKQQWVKGFAAVGLVVLMGALFYLMRKSSK